MSKQTKPKRPVYSLEFKQDAAKLVIKKGYTQQQAADSLGVSLSTIRRWVRAERGPAVEAKSTPNLYGQTELVRLRKEVEQLRLEREILKQARHATSRNSGTPVAVIRSPTQRIGDAPAALRPPQTEHKAAQSWLPQMALRLFGIKF
ncbi:transposase, IS3 family [Bathymodiolus japonicus methanotrophic gill symbiont]|nr:transposase, IS3 family [Bathymodiolus japonicus methanotrophic gill symbiont]